MTKFTATVCLPPTEPADVPSAIAGRMAPYEAEPNGEFNPAGEWDWWSVFALAREAFLVLPGHDGDPRVLTAANVPRGVLAYDELEPLECLGGPRGLLDFAAMRARAARRYEAGDPFPSDLAQAVSWAVPGYAVVALDGSWTDASSDGYWERANRYLDALAPDTLLVEVGCHM
ncbi:hypothetical protein [Streptomyces sp. NPDC020917]|uniref:hypothetical protein n=1 Tax=Streptomyces sp. NPDC020917 TaxID=3365102 RepID=UPI0037BE0775